MTEDIIDFVFIFFHVQKCTSWQVTGRSGTLWHPPRTVFTCIMYSAPKLKCHFHLKLLYHEVSAEKKEAKTKNCTRYNICTVVKSKKWRIFGWLRAHGLTVPRDARPGHCYDSCWLVTFDWKWIGDLQLSGSRSRGPHSVKWSSVTSRSLLLQIVLFIFQDFAEWNLKIWLNFVFGALLLEVTAVKNGYSLKIMLFSAIHI